MFSSIVIERLGPPLVLLLLRQVVDTVASGASGRTLVEPLIWLVMAMIGTELLAAATGMVGERFWMKMHAALDERVLAKATSLSMVQFDDAGTHDLIERATQGHGVRLGNFCWRTMHTAATVIASVSTLALLAASSPWLALAGSLGAVPMAVMGVRRGRRTHSLERRQSPGRRLTQYLGGLLSRREAATELRAYQLVPYFLGRWRHSWLRRRADHLDVHAANLREGWFSELLSGALLVAALGMVVYLAAKGQVGAGDVVVIIGGVRLLQESLTTIAVSTGMLWDHGLTIGDLRKFLELPVPSRPPDQGLPFPDPLSGPIRFEKVVFRYPGGEQNVLDGVSFEVKPGEKIALVGHNGAGKSTLVKLLLGLYTPTSGRITISGADVREISPRSLQASVSCVFQDFMRFDMTLHDNVAIGNLQATRAEVEQAGSAAGLTETVDRLPHGYDSQLGRTFGGFELSGGQWQRVALARAFVRGAQLLVLDEPTAALDPKAELEVFGKFVELVEGRTAFLISHRLGSARLADRVIVLDGGRVTEVGTHQELMAAGGLYAQLFRTQARWYDESLHAADPVGEVS